MHLYVGLLILTRQLLEVFFLYLVMFGIVFRMFRLFSSSCHQLITAELHFTNKRWLEPIWLGYCCLEELEKIIISLPLEVDMDSTAGSFTSLLPLRAKTSSFCFLEGAFLLFERRTHMQNAFAPETQCIRAGTIFPLNDSHNAILHHKTVTPSL